MNLVESIKDQLSGALVNQLSSQIGASEGATRSAVAAAVPALLSALSGLAAGGGSGTQKLVSALESFGAGSVENLVPKMSNQPGSVLEQGASILSSLFGSGTISGIVNALSKFASIAPGSTQKLLGYLAPLVMAAISGRLGGKAPTAHALSSLFADEKANIASALPSGFSLRDVPGLAAAGPAVRLAEREVAAAGSGLAKWMLPLAGIAALGLLAWWLTSSAPAPAPDVKAPTVTRAQSPETHRPIVPEGVKSAIPDVTKFGTELTDTFGKLTEALTGVKDAASAETALPKLQDIEGKLDVAKTTMKELGEAGKATIKTLAKSAQVKVKELVEKVLAMPGVGEKIKAVVDSIMTKLTELSA